MYSQSTEYTLAKRLPRMQHRIESRLLSDIVHSSVRSCAQIVWFPNQGSHYWVTLFSLSTSSHNGTGLRKNGPTCPWGCPGGTESGNLRTGASWFQQWHWVSESDWLLSMIKPDGTKQLSGLADQGTKRGRRQQTCKSWIRKFSSLLPFSQIS